MKARTTLHQVHTFAACGLFALATLLHGVPPAAQENVSQSMTGDRETPAPKPATFSLTGTWAYGALPGHDPKLGTMYSGDKTATATWEPRVHSPSPVRVSLWISPHERNTGEARMAFHYGH